MSQSPYNKSSYRFTGPAFGLLLNPGGVPGGGLYNHSCTQVSAIEHVSKGEFYFAIAIWLSTNYHSNDGNGLLNQC
jgi:hypothetical protein